MGCDLSRGERTLELSERVARVSRTQVGKYERGMEQPSIGRHAFEIANRFEILDKLHAITGS